MSKGAQDNDHLLDAVALLVLDVQERLIPAMADGEVFIDRVAFALEAARQFKIRVIFTEQVPDKLGPTLPRLKALAPEARVFRKSSFSALQANGLQDYLSSLNVYHLLVCGLETPVCVYQTALQATDLDLDTTLLSDCLASRRPEDDAFVLPSLTHAGCHLLPSESVFYSMAADAENPVFRGYSQLVKHYDALRRGDEPPMRQAEARTKAVAPKQTSVRPKLEMESSDHEATQEGSKKASRRSRGRNRKTTNRPETTPTDIMEAGEPPANPPKSEVDPSPQEEAKRTTRRSRGRGRKATDQSDPKPQGEGETKAPPARSRATQPATPDGEGKEQLPKRSRTRNRKAIQKPDPDSTEGKAVVVWSAEDENDSADSTSGEVKKPRRRKRSPRKPKSATTPSAEHPSE